MLKFLSVASLALVAGQAFAENPEVGGAAMFADKTIVENAMNSADHTTLVAAVVAAGLAETLSGEGPFTVFAPVNAAFDALPAGTVDNLLMPENMATLQKILTCHVVAAEAFSADIIGMIEADGGRHPVQTIGGCILQASVMDGMVTRAAPLRLAALRASWGLFTAPSVGTNIRRQTCGRPFCHNCRRNLAELFENLCACPVDARVLEGGCCRHRARLGHRAFGSS